MHGLSFDATVFDDSSQNLRFTTSLRVLTIGKDHCHNLYIYDRDVKLLHIARHQLR